MPLFSRKNLSFQHQLFWLQLLLAAAIVAALSYFGLFLYRDFYETVVQAEAVIVLKKEVALKDIDMPGFEQAARIETKKHQRTLPARLPDIFAPLP